LPSAKIALLKSIENISDEVKAQELLPVMQELVQNLRLSDQIDNCLEEYVTLVVSSLDKSSSSALNEENDTSWPIFVSVLRYFFQSGVPIGNMRSI
jgi:U3 small nucleolar RNA-associated protein 10